MEPLFKFFEQVNGLLTVMAIIVAVVLSRFKVPQIRVEAFSKSLKEHQEMLAAADQMAVKMRDELKVLRDRVEQRETEANENREESRMRDAALIAYQRRCRAMEAEIRSCGGRIPPKDELLRHIEETL